MTEDKPYNAISCADHDGYESAIVLRQKLQLEWIEEDQSHHTEIIKAKDLETLNQEEFLIAESENGTLYRIRLDRIIKYSVC